jgi:hypothetical protein
MSAPFAPKVSPLLDRLGLSSRFPQEDCTARISAAANTAILVRHGFSPGTLRAGAAVVTGRKRAAVHYRPRTAQIPRGAARSQSRCPARRRARGRMGEAHLAGELTHGGVTFSLTSCIRRYQNFRSITNASVANLGIPPHTPTNLKGAVPRQECFLLKSCPRNTGAQGWAAFQQ